MAEHRLKREREHTQYLRMHARRAYYQDGDVDVVEDDSRIHAQ